MVVEKLHGLQTTGMSLNERFSMLASAVPERVAMRQKRRSIGAYMNSNLNVRNRNIIEQIAKKFEQQARRQAIKQRLGMGPAVGLRRFGSESSLPGLRRSNSFNSLNQNRDIKHRIGWRQSNGNLSRSASFGNLSGATWGARPQRGYRRRGWIRGGRQGVGRVTRVLSRGPRMQTQRLAARGAGRGAGRGTTRVAGRGVTRGAGRGASRGATRGVARGAATGRGRGGVFRSQTPKPEITKEELDLQLEQYMAGSKAALDKELDMYMKNAMDLE